jgi:hypothetical protein
MINLCIGVAIIILASTICKYISHKNWREVPGDAEKRLNARLAHLEQRLTDIQDVMITIDEKLSRSEVRV